MSQSRPCSHPPASLAVLQNGLAIVLQSQILQSSILQSSILQSGNPHFWDLAVMRSCSHEILQSRSKILVPLVRSFSHVTVQTLQASHSQSCSPPNALASVLQSQILQSGILQSSILQSGNLPFWELAPCSPDPRFWSHL